MNVQRTPIEYLEKNRCKINMSQYNVNQINKDTYIAALYIHVKDRPYASMWTLVGFPADRKRRKEKLK